MRDDEKVGGLSPCCSVLRVSSSVLGHGSTGKQSSIKAVAMILCAGDAQKFSPPEIATTLCDVVVDQMDE